MGNAVSSPYNILARLRGRYALVARLSGHDDCITCLSVAPSGLLLASGGYDGLRLWGLDTMVERPSPPQRHVNEAVSAVAWIIPEHGHHVLVYGTSRGSLVVCREKSNQTFEEIVHRKVGNGKTINCIATGRSTRNSHLFVIGQDGGVIQTWTFCLPSTLSNEWSRCYKEIIPMNVAWQGHADEDDVIVFNQAGGDMHILNGEDGNPNFVYEFQLQTIGYACVGKRRPLIALDHVFDGYGLYDLDTGDIVMKLATNPAKRSLPRQIAFGEDDRVVVGGSDDGFVYVFDRRTGHRLQMLHPVKGLLQVVATHYGNGVATIVAGGTVLRQTNDIYVWTRHVKSTKRNRSQWTMSYVIWAALQLIILAGATAFLWQFVQQNKYCRAIQTLSNRVYNYIDTTLTDAFDEHSTIRSPLATVDTIRISKQVHPRAQQTRLKRHAFPEQDLSKGVKALAKPTREKERPEQGLVIWVAQDGDNISDDADDGW